MGEQRPPLRAQFTLDGLMQLRTHPSPVVVRHTTISLELWGELQPGDVPEDMHLGQPIDALVAGLRTRLNALVDGDGTVLRLSNLVLHMLYVQRLMDLATVSTFTRLGAGSFATVFVSEGRGGAVVKQVPPQRPCPSVLPLSTKGIAGSLKNGTPYRFSDPQGQPPKDLNLEP